MAPLKWECEYDKPSYANASGSTADLRWIRKADVAIVTLSGLLAGRLAVRRIAPAKSHELGDLHCNRCRASHVEFPIDTGPEHIVGQPDSAGIDCSVRNDCRRINVDA